MFRKATCLSNFILSGSTDFTFVQLLLPSLFSIFAALFLSQMTQPSDSKEVVAASAATATVPIRKPDPDLVSLSSERSETDDFWFKVLALCHQRNPAHFGIEFPSWCYSKFEYLDSGTYSHVIKALDLQQQGTPVVFKVRSCTVYNLYNVV